MKDKPLIIVRGNEKELRLFATMLSEQGIDAHPIIDENADIPFGVIRETVSVVFNAVVVELTKKTVKAIFKWLKELRRKGAKSSLKITVEGDVLQLGSGDIEVLQKVLEQIVSNKKPRRKRKRKNENKA